MLINKVIREPIQESNPQISAKELNKLNLSKNMQSLHSITVQIVCALRDYFEWCAKAEERAKQIEKRFQSAQSKNISSMKLDDLSKLQMESKLSLIFRTRIFSKFWGRFGDFP